MRDLLPNVAVSMLVDDMFVPFPYSYNATVDAGSTALVGICGAQVAESFTYMFRLLYICVSFVVYICSVCCICVFRTLIHLTRRLMPGQRLSLPFVGHRSYICVPFAVICVPFAVYVCSVYIFV